MVDLETESQLLTEVVASKGTDDDDDDDDDEKPKKKKSKKNKEDEEEEEEEELDAENIKKNVKNLGKDISG